MSVRDTWEDVWEMKAGMLKTRGRWFDESLLSELVESWDM